MAFTYDTLGRRIGLSRGNGGSAAGQPASTQAIAYNPASQMASLIQANDTYSWKGHTPLVPYLVHDGLNRIQTIAAIPGGYDANANLTNDGVRKFSDDLENKLTRVEQAATGAGLPGLRSAEP